MKLAFDGSPIAAAPRAHVWACLLDPEFVVRSTPGIQKLELLGDHRHRVVSKFGVGAFALDVTMEVEVRDMEAPTRATMHAQGVVANQPVSLTSRVQLLEEGPDRTRIVWKGEAEVGGALAGIAAKMLQAVAPAMVGQFWTDFAKRVEASHA